MTPSGIEPATFRFVARYLNHCATISGPPGGSVHTIKKNSEALVVAGKESGLEVNADKTKHMVMS
jgi:hypothetical protein